MSVNNIVNGTFVVVDSLREVGEVGKHKVGIEIVGVDGFEDGVVDVLGDILNIYLRAIQDGRNYVPRDIYGDFSDTIVSIKHKSAINCCHRT